MGGPDSSCDLDRRLAVRRGRDYWWVECGTCECGWQVPHYAESVG
jgi:hypothetical protein